MRIASLSPAATEILFAIGRGDMVVCTDKFSDYPVDASRIPHLKEHQEITKESLASHAPELVFTATLVQEKLARSLEDPAWNVIHDDPRSLQDIYGFIRTVGVLLEAETEAATLVMSMRQTMNDVKKKAALLPRRPCVYVEEWHHPPMVSGNWVPEVVRIAGGEPFPLPAGAPSRKVSLEEVEAFDPDLIVLSICGAGTYADRTLLTGREGWKDLPAVQRDDVRVIDDSLLNRPGPRLTEGASRLYGWLFEALH